MSKPRLLFVSPRFLFPIDSGGKIRTTGILREMKDGHFDITVVSPAPPNRNLEGHMSSIANQWDFWPEIKGLRRKTKRYASLIRPLPVSIASDLSASAKKLISDQLAQNIDLVVFDFVHAAVLAPRTLNIPSVLFTHNIEAEIFARHFEVAQNPLMKSLWQSQWKKMHRFEGRALSQFDSVVAVSERDKKGFQQDYGATNVETIPTGVDLPMFPYNYKRSPGKVVFTGSMDWIANQDGIEYFMSEIWPKIIKKNVSAEMCVVGRTPPENLVNKASPLGEQWSFTGFVDDVRPYIQDASVYVIPLRVGGGTRLKVFEAMASGCPVVSTAIGVEGLGLKDGEHYLNAETPQEFADATVELLQNEEKAQRLSKAARQFVEDNASNTIVARRFEAICLDTLNARN